METAIAYCRVSDPRQVDEGNSLTTQEKQAREHAQRSSYLLDRIFVERGESAKTDDRRVLKEMLAYCQANRGKIQVVIIPKIDRLARNRDDYGALKLFLSRLNIRLDSVGERIEDTPVGRFTESILASVAQLDNEIRAERSKGGMIEAVREGRWVWKAPRGYQNVHVNGKANIAPDPRIGPLVQEAFERIIAGYSAKEVRAWLAQNRVPVSLSGFHEMVRNKAYLGFIDSFGLLQQGSPPFVALVTPANFYRAQEALQRKQAGPRRYDRDNPDFPLRGTLICECGKPFTACWSQGMNDRYPYYRCISCERKNIPRTEVEKQFLEELSAYRFAPDDVDRLIKTIRRKWQDRNAEAIEYSAQSDQEILRLRSLRTSVALKNAEGVIPDDIAKEQIEDLGRQIGLLEGEERQPKPTSQDIEAAVRFGTDFLVRMGFWWFSANLENRKRLQSFLYPSGLVYTRINGFRTADYPLLEGVKDIARGNESNVVDQDTRFYEQLIEFFRVLRMRFE